MYSHSSNAWVGSPGCEAAANNVCLEGGSTSHCFTVFSIRSFVSNFHWNTTLFHTRVVVAMSNTCCLYEHMPCNG